VRATANKGQLASARIDGSIALARHRKPHCSLRRADSLPLSRLLASLAVCARAAAALCDMQCAALWRRAESPSLPGRPVLGLRCRRDLGRSASYFKQRHLRPAGAGGGPAGRPGWQPRLPAGWPCSEQCTAGSGPPLIRPVSAYHGIMVHRCCAPACLNVLCAQPCGLLLYYSGDAGRCSCNHTGTGTAPPGR
jgi:hypothetical protein